MRQDSEKHHIKGMLERTWEKKIIYKDVGKCQGN